MTTSPLPVAPAQRTTRPGTTPATLVDLLDRVLSRGAAIRGDVVIAVAGVDLIRLDLRLLLAAIDTAPLEDAATRSG
jgi:hypothetical protein